MVPVAIDKLLTTGLVNRERKALRYDTCITALDLCAGLFSSGAPVLKRLPSMLCISFLFHLHQEAEKRAFEEQIVITSKVR